MKLEVAPFAAIRFDHTKTSGDISALIAPPYDVLDQTDKDALLARSDKNIVAIDLPHLPPKSAGPAECYDKAARTLTTRLHDGTLTREEKPALYLYHQTFTNEGKTYTRKKFIARVRLHPFEDGVILPHELTFGGPKEDRLALMKATKCQLSPIFGLYADPMNQVGKAFASTAAARANAAGTLNDVRNELWIVTDEEVIHSVVGTVSEGKLYIADGHHRYGTALLYQAWAAEQHGSALPPDHPANFVMFVLASMDDPGCLILPYCRTLKNVTASALLDAWSDGVAKCDATEADMVLMDGATEIETPLRFTNREALKELEPDQSAPWYNLDYAYLHRYLLDELYKKNIAGEPKIKYVKSTAAAKEAAKKQAGVALLMKATPLGSLRAVSDAGGFMPQKSTYFYPKLATGMTINPLE